MSYETSIYKKANREIFEFIRNLDGDSTKTRPVHFFFYTMEESDAYRLAGELQNLDFGILEVSNTMNSQWLCLAEMDLCPEPKIMDRCVKLLLNLADRYDAIYDGWEVRIGQ